MTFEGKGLRVIIPLDPSQGERYTEPLRDEDQDVLEHIYNITAKEEDYVDPSAEGIIDWQCNSSCMTDSDDGLENWQNLLYELHGHRCARLTKSLRWLTSQTSALPIFDSSTNTEEFSAPFLEQIPDSQPCETMDSASRATAARWWDHHKKYIPHGEACQNSLRLRFVDQLQEVRSRFDGQSSLQEHLEHYYDTWKHVTRTICSTNSLDHHLNPSYRSYHTANP